jgi:hypothetical protein
MGVSRYTENRNMRLHMLILMALVLVPQGACMQVQIVPDIWSKKALILHATAITNLYNHTTKAP